LEIILFFDIDGVFSLMGTELSAEKIGDVWAWPIPNAAAIIQAIDQDSRIAPVWLSHWGERSTAWNDYAGTQHWPVAFPITDDDASRNADKISAIGLYLYVHDPRNASMLIWVQDGFSPAEQQWAVQNSVRLLDTTVEPIRSMLLNDSVDAAIELVSILAGSESVL
jgi:hypothetical protein